MNERRKPITGYMQAYNFEHPEVLTFKGMTTVPDDQFVVPVVVTPLEPGDPKPGEAWASKKYGTKMTISSAPFVVGGSRRRKGVAHVDDAGRPGWDMVDDLRPVPVLKTFRLRGSVIEAESKDAALKQLADMLEEVPS